MATKKPAAVKKRYMAFYTNDTEFHSSIEGAAGHYDNGDLITVYEMVEVGRFEVSTKPILKPIK